jgi:hypothetical protein
MPIYIYLSISMTLAPKHYPRYENSKITKGIYKNLSNFDTQVCDH